MANTVSVTPLVNQLDNAAINRSQRGIVPSADSNVGPVRIDRDNSLFVENLFPGLQTLALEGSLYVAQTATPGTGITLTSATGTTYSDTQAIFGVNNLDVNPSLGNNGRDIIPLWLKLVITAAGTAGTDAHFASRLDKGARVSAGTQLTPTNMSASYPAGDSSSYIAVLPTVAAATGNIRNCGRAEGRKAAAPAYIVGDVIIFLFGVAENVAAQAITPTTAVILTLPMPGIVIAPGWSWVMNEWMTARSGAQSAEVEFGYLVR